MPERCVICRGGSGLEKLLKARYERRLAEENALEGIRMYFPPGAFGVLSTRTVPSVDVRIEEVRKAWREDVEALCNLFEETEGRDQW